MSKSAVSLFHLTCKVFRYSIHRFNHNLGILQSDCNWTTLVAYILDKADEHSEQFLSIVIESEYYILENLKGEDEDLRRQQLLISYEKIPSLATLIASEQMNQKIDTMENWC